MQKIFNWLYIFFMKFFFYIVAFITIIRIVFLEKNIKFVLNNWHLSKNGNYYNPSSYTTVFYSYDSYWMIAKYGKYNGKFKTRYEGQYIAFKSWMIEYSASEKINFLYQKLNRLKFRILTLKYGAEG